MSKKISETQEILERIGHWSAKLSTRTRNAILRNAWNNEKEHGVTTLEDLITFQPDRGHGYSFLCSGIGDDGLKEVCEMLKGFGLGFGLKRPSELRDEAALMLKEADRIEGLINKASMTTTPLRRRDQ